MAELRYAFIKDHVVKDFAMFDNSNEELILLFKNHHDLDNIVIAPEGIQVNFIYDGTKFWSPQPYPSWIKNEELNEWEPPISYPVFDEENPKYYTWNEDILNWEEIQVSE